MIFVWRSPLASNKFVSLLFINFCFRDYSTSSKSSWSHIHQSRKGRRWQVRIKLCRNNFREMLNLNAKSYMYNIISHIVTIHHLYQNTQKILFLCISTWENFSIFYTLSKSPVYLISFIHIYHFDMVSLTVCRSHVTHIRTWPCSLQVFHSSLVTASNQYFGPSSWVQIPLGARKIIFLSTIFWFYPSRQSNDLWDDA